MIILRQKTYSKFTSSLGGAIKGAGYGAGIGAAVMPGWKLAALSGKYKLAAGIAGTGALIGGIAGAKSGWDSGKSKWEYDHDPKVREKVDKENSKRIKKAIENNRGFDETLAKNLNYSSWQALAKKIPVPAEFLKYVKFYKDTWSKKIELWYSSMDSEKIDEVYEVPEFKTYFPIPINSKTTEDWWNIENDDGFSTLCLATYNEAGDDGWLCYSPNTGKYGVDSPDYSESLKKTLMVDLKKLDDTLSDKQIEMIKEFNNKINTIL